MRFPGFIGQSYQHGASLSIDCQRTLNMYLEKNESGRAKDAEPFSLVPTPGLVTLVTLATRGFRALWTASDKTLYAACGNKFYKIASDLTATALGTFLTSSGTMKVDDNGSQIVMVDGTYGYVYTLGTTYFAQVDTIAVNDVSGVPGHVYAFTINGTAISYTSTNGDTQFTILTSLNDVMEANNVQSTGVVTGTGSSALLTITANQGGTANTYASVDAALTQTNTVANGSQGPTFSQITDPAFAGADVVDYVDGYFVFNKPGTQEWYISQLDDVTFNALDFASAEASPDQLVTLAVVHQYVWLFGLKSTEIWYDAGEATFPFARVQGASLDIGCAAKFSVAKLGNTVFWLGAAEEGEGVVYMANAFQPQRVSTHAIEAAIRSYGDVSDADAFCYQQDGHGFYWLNFPSAGASWVFDMGSGTWHERGYISPTTGQVGRHRASCHAYAYGKHFVGDFENGNLYQLDRNTYSDAGDAILRLRSSPYVSNAGKWLFFSLFQLDIESGIGLDGTGQGTDPTIMLDWSDDGGRTWSNERTASAGRIGGRMVRALWRRLGKGRSRVWRTKFTDPCKFVISGANIEFESEAA